ncbi:MAG TPA: hypothetical protein VFU28_19435 [Vicinamibacterales bacterium]|nr:hypothetical protein [Vicinamibacterales bacterium]
MATSLQIRLVLQLLKLNLRMTSELWLPRHRPFTKRRFMPRIQIASPNHRQQCLHDRADARG